MGNKLYREGYKDGLQRGLKIASDMIFKFAYNDYHWGVLLGKNSDVKVKEIDFVKNDFVESEKMSKPAYRIGNKIGYLKGIIEEIEMSLHSNNIREEELEQYKALQIEFEALFQDFLDSN